LTAGYEIDTKSEMKEKSRVLPLTKENEGRAGGMNLVDITYEHWVRKPFEKHRCNG
jgi:hypothetical protein